MNRRTFFRRSIAAAALAVLPMYAPGLGRVRVKSESGLPMVSSAPPCDLTIRNCGQHSIGVAGTRIVIMPGKTATISSDGRLIASTA